METALIVLLWLLVIAIAGPIIGVIVAIVAVVAVGLGIVGAVRRAMTGEYDDED